MKSSSSLLCLLCALLAILLSLASCQTPMSGGLHAEAATLPSTDPTGEPPAPVTIPKIGREIVIGTDYTPPAERGISSDCFAEEEMKAIAHVEQLYSVTIRFVTQDQLDSIYRHYWQGDICDLAVNVSTQKYASGYYYRYYEDLNTIESLKLESAGFNQAQQLSHSLYGKLYACVSDFTVGNQSVYGILCNNDLYCSLGFEDDLYGIVQDGDWTFEKQFEIASVFGTSAPADTAFLLQNKMLAHLYMYSQGFTVLTTDRDVVFGGEAFVSPLQTSNLNALKQAASNAHSLISQESVTLVETSDKRLMESDEWAKVVSGKTLFTPINLNPTLTSLQGINFETRFLPIPKAEQSDPYLTFAYKGYCVIPTHVQSKEESGMILQALSDYASRHMVKTVAEGLLAPLGSASDADRAMIDFIRSTSVYDFGLGFEKERQTPHNIFYSILFGSTGSVENATKNVLNANKSAVSMIEQDANRPFWVD